MDLTIRSGSAADHALCWALYRQAVLEGAAPHYSEAQRAAWAGAAEEPPWIAERLAAGRVWVAEAGDAVGFLVASGMVTAGGQAPEGTPSGAGAGDAGPGAGAAEERASAHIDLFFVRPDVRGKGVAAALYDAFEAAVGADAPGGRLTADASLLLRPFLERRGWQALDEEWVERDGVILNRFQMEKRL